MGDDIGKSERDLLIRLDESVGQLKDEIKNLRELITSSVSDHEARLRVLEKQIDRADGAVKVIYAMITLMALVLGALWWVHK